MTGRNPERDGNKPDKDLSHEDSYEEINNGHQDSTHHVDKSFKIVHPVENVEELGNSIHLEKRLREANLEKDVPIESRSEEDEKQINEEFDKKTLEYIPVALNAEGLDTESEDVELESRYVHALTLKLVREFSYKDFASHLKEYDFATNLLDLEFEASKSTIWNWKSELEDDQFGKLKNASTRVQFALFRSGTIFPSNLRKEIDLPFDLDPEIVEQRQLEPNVKVSAFCNWAEEFVERCIVEPLDLGRDADSVTYPKESFYGLLAHAALQSVTMESAHKSCEEWLIDPDYVPHGKTVRDRVRKKSVKEIADMFHEANKQFLDFASEYTIIDDSKDVAYDTTNIVFVGENDEQPWAKRFGKSVEYRMESSEEALRWEFGILGIMENDVRFALGLYPIDEETDYADGLNRVLREPRKNSDMPVNKVMMDRGLSGARLVDRCRSLIGENWIMNARKIGELGELVEETPQGETKFDDDPDHLEDITNKPNAYVVPVMEDWNHTNDDHMVFLTDLPKEKLDEDYIKNKYRTRGRIEKTLEQVKCDFRVPRQRSNKPEEAPSVEWEYFLLNLSMLFFNLHNLIQNSLSPKYALPLGEKERSTWNVVLSAIRKVAFTKAKEV